jgi:hypothetical protein
MDTYDMICGRSGRTGRAGGARRFVLAGHRRFRAGLLLMIAVSAGTFACALAPRGAPACAERDSRIAIRPLWLRIGRAEMPW